MRPSDEMPAGAAQTGIDEIDDAMVMDALNDPLRARLWMNLRQPRTARELSAMVGVPAPRLYYHLDILERHGWIVGAGERKSSTRPQRVWRSARPSYSASPRLVDAGDARTDGMVLGVLDDIACEMAGGSVDDEGRSHQVDLIIRRSGNLTAAQAKALRDEVAAVIDRHLPGWDSAIDERGVDRGEGTPFFRLAFTLARWD